MSTASLPLASDKPKTLSKAGAGLSRSSPALAAAFNLRQFAEMHNHIPSADRPSSASTFSRPGKVIPIEKIDLLGGNGRWRQRKAEKEFERRRAEEQEKRRQDKIREEERRRKQAHLAERKRQHQLEEERRWQEEREQKRLEQLERERKKREEEERERQRREDEERERLRRQPKTCEICEGSGKCTACMGKGFYFSMFLVNKVTKETLLDYGRKLQGCMTCGGYPQGVVGDLQKGTGLCPNCHGRGMVWPVIDGESSSPSRMRGMTTAWMSRSEQVAPSAIEA